MRDTLDLQNVEHDLRIQLGGLVYHRSFAISLILANFVKHTVNRNIKNH